MAQTLAVHITIRQENPLDLADQKTMYFAKPPRTASLDHCSGSYHSCHHCKNGKDQIDLYPCHNRRLRTNRSLKPAEFNQAMSSASYRRSDGRLKKLPHAYKFSCRKQYCTSCLTAKYGFTAEHLLRARISFKCPSCHESCLCSACVYPKRKHRRYILYNQI